MTPTDDFLTTEELLDYLQVNVQTVHRLIKSGQIPPVRVGRQWLFRRKDIDGWLESSRPSAEGSAVQDESHQHPSVLVVDDDRAVRELLFKALTGAGYSVDAAADATEALARLRDKSFDLMITDLKMPGMDGLALIREARLLAPGLPVIVVTGYSTEEKAIEAINLGVVGYLTKPFRLPRILATTARALGEPVPRAEV